MPGSVPSLAGRFEQVLPLAMSGSADIDVVLTHGRGQAPREVRVVALCLAAEGVFKPGDECGPVQGFGAATYNTGTLWANAAQIGFVIRAATFPLVLPDRNGGTTTLATPYGKKWALKVYANW